MKKRIVSMILAVSMMLSILPVSAFADDTGGGMLLKEASSETVEQTNGSEDISEDNQYYTVSTNPDNGRTVVTIKMGTDGKPLAAEAVAEAEDGTYYTKIDNDEDPNWGWSYVKDAVNKDGVEYKNALVLSAGSSDTEFVLEGTVDCDVYVMDGKKSGRTFLKDSTVTGTVYLDGSSMDSANILSGTYSNVSVTYGNIYGGTFDKVTLENGRIYGGTFSALEYTGVASSIQAGVFAMGCKAVVDTIRSVYSDAHTVTLPENCTVNGVLTGSVYLVTNSSYKQTLTIRSPESDIFGWIVEGMYTYGSNGDLLRPKVDTDISGGDVSVSEDCQTLTFTDLYSVSKDLKVYPAKASDKELRFTAEGIPDLDGAAKYEITDYWGSKKYIYIGKGWSYEATLSEEYNMLTSGILYLYDLQGKTLDFNDTSLIPADTALNCSMMVQNGTLKNLTGGFLMEVGLVNGSIENSQLSMLALQDSTASDVTAVSLFLGGSSKISNVITAYSGDEDFKASVKPYLADGQNVSKLTVANGVVYTANGFGCMGEGDYFSNFYLIGKVKADFLLNTDIVTVNDVKAAELTADNIKVSDGTILHLTSKNDGADYQINDADTPTTAKALQITEKGLPDVTGVYGQAINYNGITATMYTGDGWQYMDIVDAPDGFMYPVGTGLLGLTSDNYDNSAAWPSIDLSDPSVNKTGADLKCYLQLSAYNLTGGNFAKGTVVMSSYANISNCNIDALAEGYQTAITNCTVETASLGSYSTAANSRFGTLYLTNDASVTGATVDNVRIANDASAKVSGSVILNGLTIEEQKTDGNVPGFVTVSNTISRTAIDEQYWAEEQKQSKLTAVDGTITAINGNAVGDSDDSSSVYLIGNARADVTTSFTIGAINGKDASAYNKDTSFRGSTLTIVGNNDGAEILIGKAAVQKQPFSDLKGSDFKVDTADGEDLQTGSALTVTQKPEGVGDTEVVFERTRDGESFDVFPDEPGIYNIVIHAEEGDVYEAGSITVASGLVVKYKPTDDDFAYDADTNTVTYVGGEYFDDIPKWEIKYTPVGGGKLDSEEPTEPGTYWVWVSVSYTDHYEGGGAHHVGTYTVVEKLPFEGFTLSDFEQTANKDGTYTFSLEGAGKLTMVCKRGYDGKEFINREPSDTDYGHYTLTIYAEEGTLYKAGSILLQEASIPYTVTSSDFRYNAGDDSVTYIGTRYFENDPDVTLLYVTEGGNVEDAVAAKPTEPGRYDVYVDIPMPDDYIDNRYQYDYVPVSVKVGTYVVAEVGKYALTFGTASTKNSVTAAVNGEPIASGTTLEAGTSVTLTAEYSHDGTYQFNGWKLYNGLKASDLGLEEADLLKDSITFQMPEQDVSINAIIDQVSTLHFDTEYITVAADQDYYDDDDTLQPVYNGEPLKVLSRVQATAADRPGYTFSHWEITGTVYSGNVNTPITEEELKQSQITFWIGSKSGSAIVLEAVYEKNAPSPDQTYLLTVINADAAEEDGTAVDSGSKVKAGTKLVVTAPAQTGYFLSGWTVSGVSEYTAVDNTITFTMPENEVTVTPVYHKNITASSDGTIILPDDIAEGETVTNEEEGWSITKQDGKTTVTISKGSAIDGSIWLGNNTLICDELVLEDGATLNCLNTSANVTLKPGSTAAYHCAFSGDVTSEGTIIGGEYSGNVTNKGTITGGTFTQAVTNEGVGVIEGGVFVNEPDTTVGWIKLNVVGAGASLTYDPSVTSVYIVNRNREQYVHLAYDDPNHDFCLWRILQPGSFASLNSQSDHLYTCVPEQTEDVTLAPVVYFNKTDMIINDVPDGTPYTTDDFQSKIPGAAITGILYYELDRQGNWVDDTPLHSYPTKAGTYEMYVQTAKTSTSSSEIATYDQPIDNTTVVMVDNVGYFLSDSVYIGKITVKDSSTPDPVDPTPTPDGGGDGSGAIVIAAAVGGVAIGAGAYVLGTTAYLKSVLPEGVDIPTNRQQLAVALWTAAGKPETASTAVFSDVPADSADLTAIRWAVDTGLLTADGSAFKPGSHVTRIEVIKVWNNFKAQ